MNVHCMGILESLLSVGDELQSADLNEERRFSSALSVNNEETKNSRQVTRGHAITCRGITVGVGFTLFFGESTAQAHNHLNS